MSFPALTLFYSSVLEILRTLQGLLQTKGFSRRVDFLLMLQGWKNGSPQQVPDDLFFFLLNVNVLERASSWLPAHPACLGHNHTSVLPALVL